MDEPLMGVIALMPYSFAPKGWAECAGQIISVGQNEALFALIGTKFGGDGSNTFALPKLSAPPGMKYCIAIEGWFPTQA